MNATSLEQLKNYGMGELVELPPFEADQPLVARLRKPKLINLIKAGKIPNFLLKTVDEIFDRSQNRTEEDFKSKKFSEIIVESQPYSELLEIFAKESLVSPTYKEITEAGLELSLEQLQAIFQYTQGGVKALESFRKNRENNDGSEHVKNAVLETVSNSES